MNIPKNKDETFYADINIFFSTYLPVYIHKVFNFALYQQDVNRKQKIAYYQMINIILSVHKRMITVNRRLITYPARNTSLFCQHY